MSVLFCLIFVALVLLHLDTERRVRRAEAALNAVPGLLRQFGDGVVNQFGNLANTTKDGLLAASQDLRDLDSRLLHQEARCCDGCRRELEKRVLPGKVPLEAIATIANTPPEVVGKA